MPAADSAPDECFSVARYRLLHHTAVSFVPSDIRVLCVHISSFLLHIRRQAAGDAASSSPDMAGGSADGATATAASAAGTGMHVDTDATPPAVADDPHTTAHSHADDGDAVAARSAREAAIPSPKKRRSSCGPAHEARRKAFYASKKARTTSAPSTWVGAGTEGADGRGV